METNDTFAQLAEKMLDSAKRRQLTTDELKQIAGNEGIVRDRMIEVGTEPTLAQEAWRDVRAVATAQGVDIEIPAQFADATRSSTVRSSAPSALRSAISGTPYTDIARQSKVNGDRERY